MKNYMVLSLAISSIILGSSTSKAFGQTDDNTSPTPTTQPKVMQEQQNNTISPQEMKNPDCDTDSSKCKGKRVKHPKTKKKHTKKIMKQDNSSQDNSPTETNPPSSGGGY
jgi:hypothetical protein